MKYLVLVVLACNQVAYDQLYKQMLLQAIETMNIPQKIEAVEFLRKLCRGQISTYERGKPWKKTLKD